MYVDCLVFFENKRKKETKNGYLLFDIIRWIFHEITIFWVDSLTIFHLQVEMKTLCSWTNKQNFVNKCLYLKPNSCLHCICIQDCFTGERPELEYRHWRSNIFMDNGYECVCTIFHICFAWINPMLFIVWIVLRWVPIFCDNKLPSFSIKFIVPDENFTCENVATPFSMSMKWMRFPNCTPSMSHRLISANSFLCIRNDHVYRFSYRDRFIDYQHSMWMTNIFECQWFGLWLTDISFHYCRYHKSLVISALWIRWLTLQQSLWYYAQVIKGPLLDY